MQRSRGAGGQRKALTLPTLRMAKPHHKRRAPYQLCREAGALAFACTQSTFTLCSFASVSRFHIIHHNNEI